MFLHVSVILLTGGEGVSGQNPPRTRQIPPAGRTPPWQGEPPRTRQTQQQGEPPWQADTPPQGKPPWDQADTPRTRQTPPPGRENHPHPPTPTPGRQNHHPPPAGRTPPPGPGRQGKKTAAYGQWAACTHPTGMHSCINYKNTLDMKMNHDWYSFSIRDNVC